MQRREFLSAAAGATLAAGTPSGSQAAAARTYKRIATEEGWTTEGILAANARLAPTIKVPMMTRGGPADALAAQCADIGAGRIATMDRDGVDMQVLMISAPGVQPFSASEGAALARDSNDQLADAIRRYPTRFAGLAACAPQDPQAAVREIERGINTLHLNGIIINSHTNNEYLSEQRYWPILEAAEALDAAIYIHPRDPAAQLAGSNVPYLSGAGWAYGVEVGTHVMHMIAARVFDRFPRLRIVIGHRGCPAAETPAQRICAEQHLDNDQRHELRAAGTDVYQGTGTRARAVRDRLSIRAPGRGRGIHGSDAVDGRTEAPVLRTERPTGVQDQDGLETMARSAAVLMAICVAIALLSAASSAQQAGPTSPAETSEFQFIRLVYSTGAGDFRRGRRNSWTTDAPEAETHLLQGIRRLTRVDAASEGRALQLTDEALFDFPFLYAVEVGHWWLSDEEAAQLREYLLRGGFLMVDDFHGTEEWLVFVESIRRVFPDRPIVDLKDQHPIFHVHYNVDQRVQIPSIRGAITGQTWERDGVVPYWRGVLDDQGRVMVAINFNMDLGDAWEHADNPLYPQPLTTLAYYFGINYLLYAMTH
jgi:predicted TIM-barrel fold metal-dependent hydrolase